MFKRRDFLKRLFFGTGYFSALKFPEVSFLNERKADKRFMWEYTIFCRTDDAKLIEFLKGLGEKLSCQVIFGEPSHPDLVAVPYFVAIIDRHAINQEMWEFFTRFRKETNDDTLLILIDDLKEFPLPDFNYWIYLDRRDSHSFVLLEMAVTKAYLSVDAQKYVDKAFEEQRYFRPSKSDFEIVE